MAKRNLFSSIYLEGTLITQDFLGSLLDKKSDVTGIEAEDYWLPRGYRIQDEISKSWDIALKYWQVFSNLEQQLTADESGVTLTRERWLLPLFQQLQYGRLQYVRSLEAGDETFQISHAYGQVPVHMIGYRQSLDTCSETISGKSRVSAHGLVQNYLNKHDTVQWGIVTNGLRLRLLRDNANVARMSYIEFNLEDMMNFELYRDFSIMWLMIHASRFSELKEYMPSRNWLEIWAEQSRNQGLRMRNKLCVSACSAVETLGTGFLQNNVNSELRQKLQTGRLKPDEFKQQLLRIIYRFIFLFVSEDRDLLIAENDDNRNPSLIYSQYYSTWDLRKRSRKPRIDRHIDLWERMRTTMRFLYAGQPELGLPALGSALWSDDDVRDIIGCKIENTYFLQTLSVLCWTRDRNETLLAVDWRNMGSEELGSVYEVLLELVADIDSGKNTMTLVSAQGNERKSTGSYYTRSDLISSLLDSTLDPVIKNAIVNKNAVEAEKALLSLKVCDPACGSGHFLVAAVHRLAQKLAQIRTGDLEVSPAVYRRAIRDIVLHCIYGVDINPMSVELTKVALWLESMENGKPLSFLDHHIKCGNSLFGAIPNLVKKGIPDEAFIILTGDDKAITQQLKKQNRVERKLFDQDDLFVLENGSINMEDYMRIQQQVELWRSYQEDTLDDIGSLQNNWKEYVNSDCFKWLKGIADTWCSAFVQVKTEGSISVTSQVLKNVKRAPQYVSDEIKGNIARYAKQYGFFHWYLEFPEVFQLCDHGNSESERLFGWKGGFDVVLGNPPWDKIKLEEVEWFSKRNPDIAKARTKAEREKMVRELQNNDLYLYELLQQDRRIIEGNSHFAHHSGVFQRSGVGDVNTYMLFSELNETIMAQGGRAGFIVPTGIATDKGTSAFFKHLVTDSKLVSLYSFDNRRELFPDVHPQYRFSLVTLTGVNQRVDSAKFAFSLEQVSDLEQENRFFTLTKDEFDRFNPNTGNCPTFKNADEKRIASKMYHFPVLICEAREGGDEVNPWGVVYKRLIDMTNDAYLFRTLVQLENEGWKPVGNRWQKGNDWMVPLYEGKMFNLFDNRFATYENATSANLNSGQLPQLNEEEHKDPWKLPMPDMWISKEELEEKLRNDEHSVLAFRGIARATDQRTGIFCMMPNEAYGNSSPILISKNKLMYFVSSIMSTYVFDWMVRLSIGGANFNLYILQQLAVPYPNIFNERVLKTSTTWASFIHPIAVELYYTSWDMYPWAKSVGVDSPPYVWNEERRFYLKCCLDAAAFHLYGINNENDHNYIMESFTGLMNDEIKSFGCFKTRDTILEIYRWLENAAGEISGDRILNELDFPCEKKAKRHENITKDELIEKMPWIEANI